MTSRILMLKATVCSAMLVVPMLAYAQTADKPPSAAPQTTPMNPAVPGIASSTTTTTPAAPSVAVAPAAAATGLSPMPTHASAQQRTSRIVGSTVYNNGGDSIGSVDDLILGTGPAGPTAVLSIGGFLGMGSRLVTVPLRDLTYNQQTSRWHLASATKENLAARPAFAYEPQG
ncbi:PRC-barrel domain-containing protein [Neoroseomonas lacus]|uniref:Photosystem reaction center subunit H n=1 Tax=Neoroseomonas lacus TaxID=287609 RepID=A0A917NYI0_9PROT|nr:PRC-barrel domain-containing protein [Neoroseomonas lacus]GGJ41800.1 photosystem reaction center subunit H [Neoroseomonas lacus]